jgi:hypothetical protein
MDQMLNLCESQVCIILDGSPEHWDHASHQYPTRNGLPEKSVEVRDIGYKSATLSACDWLT